MRIKSWLSTCLFIALLPFAAGASTLETSAGPVEVTAVVQGLDEPWSLAFLPDGRFLVTERGGAMTLYPAGGGGGVRLAGLPKVWAEGQGGLFDVLVPRDFAEKGEILFAFAAPAKGGASTALAAARLGADGLSDLRVIWTMPNPTESPVHFGGRLAELPDGTILLTIGERGEGMPAQDKAAARGKVLRMNRDGSAPADNPDATGPLPQMWTYGHRNPQGLALDGEGRVWESEHGAQGGDEINLLEPGRNYGWPVIAYGKNYDNSPIGEGRAKEGMEQPRHYWDPSIAPSGHIVYSGKLWPEWKDDHFLGSLKFDYVSRMDPDTKGPGGWAEERIQGPETGRVRDVREAPDGSIWFLSVTEGAVFRMAPKAR